MNIFKSIAQIINPIYPKGDRPLIIDLSHYNGTMTQADMDFLYAAGVRMVIHKCSDGYQLIHPGNPMDHANYKDIQFDNCCTLAYNCKPYRMLFGAYHFFEPGNYQAGANDPDHDFEFQTLRKALIVGGTLKKVDVISLDLEDHRTLNNGVETNSNISTRSHNFWNWMQGDPVLNKVRQIIYTRNSYLNEYAPDAITWIGAKNNPIDLWCAHDAGWQFEKWSWDTIKYPNPAVKVPTPGYAKCIMRQYALDIGGLDHVGGGTIDLSVWQGSTQSFYDYFGVVNPETVSVPVILPEPDPAPVEPDPSPIVPSPEPTTALTVTLSTGMNIRTGPGTTYAKTGAILSAGTVISIISISIQPSSVWIEFSPALWVCAQLNGTKFVK